MMTFTAKRAQPNIRQDRIYCGQFIVVDGRIMLVLHDERGMWDAYDPNDFDPVW